MSCRTAVFRETFKITANETTSALDPRKIQILFFILCRTNSVTFLIIFFRRVKSQFSQFSPFASSAFPPSLTLPVPQVSCRKSFFLCLRVFLVRLTPGWKSQYKRFPWYKCTILLKVLILFSTVTKVQWYHTAIITESYILMSCWTEKRMIFFFSNLSKKISFIRLQQHHTFFLYAFFTRCWSLFIASRIWKSTSRWFKSNVEDKCWKFWKLRLWTGNFFVEISTLIMFCHQQYIAISFRKVLCTWLETFTDFLGSKVMRNDENYWKSLFFQKFIIFLY